MRRRVETNALELNPEFYIDINRRPEEVRGIQ
jgi:hypothetical protein